jgi:hypothetical protein
MKVGLPLPGELGKLIRELSIPAISAALKICSILTALHRTYCNQTAEKLRGCIYAFNFNRYDYEWPVTVAERSKACTVFARSEAGIVGSNPTQGMDVWYVFILCLGCPVFSQRPCDEPITRARSSTVCKMIMKLKNQRAGPKGAVEPVKKMIMNDAIIRRFSLYRQTLIQAKTCTIKVFLVTIMGVHSNPVRVSPYHEN